MEQVLPKTYYDFEQAVRGGFKIQVHRGGSRSGKTYSILLRLIEIAYNCPNEGLVFLIGRKTNPLLLSSVWLDFERILRDNNLWDSRNFLQHPNRYTLNGNYFRFINFEKESNFRGVKKNFLYINEADEIDYDTFRQLVLRAEDDGGIIILDFNPASPSSYIRKFVEVRKDAITFTSSYKDNPFVSKTDIAELEQYKELDPEYYQVFGLGEYASGSTNIYNNFKIADFSKNTFEVNQYNTGIGIDYGFNDPTAIVQVTKHDNCFYVKSLLSKSGMQTNNIADFINTNNLAHFDRYFDTAHPGVMKDLLYSYGLYCHPADKRVLDGIAFCRSKQIFVDENDEQLIECLQNYKWKKDRNGNILDEPDPSDSNHRFSHLLDAMRYAVYTKWKYESNV